MWNYGVGSTGLGCDHGNKPLGSIKGDNFLISWACYLLIKNSVSWSQRSPIHWILTALRHSFVSFVPRCTFFDLRNRDVWRSMPLLILLPRAVFSNSLQGAVSFLQLHLLCFKTRQPQNAEFKSESLRCVPLLTYQLSVRFFVTFSLSVTSGDSAVRTSTWKPTTCTKYFLVLSWRYYMYYVKIIHGCISILFPKLMFTNIFTILTKYVVKKPKL
jgi:hypothetical protein